MYTTNVPITILKEDVEGSDGDDDDDDDDDDEDEDGDGDGWPTSEHTREEFSRAEKVSRIIKLNLFFPINQ